MLGNIGNQSDIINMKILRDKPREPLKPISIQLRPSLIKLLDEAAGKAQVSRQKLLGMLLEQVLTDKHFTLKVKD